MIFVRVCLNRTYFTETENWKHYNKINFKYVNSAVELIFNEKVAEKWNLWVHEQYNKCSYQNKKKSETRWKQNVDTISRIQTLP